MVTGELFVELAEVSPNAQDLVIKPGALVVMPDSLEIYVRLAVPLLATVQLVHKMERRAKPVPLDFGSMPTHVPLVQPR